MIPTEPALESRANLEWIAGKWGELKNRLRKAGGDPNAPRVGGSKEPPSEIDWHVSDLMHEITQHAVFLGRVLLEESDWRQEHGEMPGLLTDVASQFGHFVTGDEKTAWDFVDQAEEFRRKVEGVLNRPERARYVGDCPTEDCRGDLYLPGGAEGGRCRECGTAWTMAEQRAWLRDQMDTLLLTYSETFVALKLLGLEISDRTWERWTSSGTVDRPKVPKVAKNADDLYPLIDAVRMAAALPKYRQSEEVLATVGVV